MDKENEYYAQFGSFGCSEPEDKPSFMAEEEPVAGEERKPGIFGEAPSDEEEAASTATS
jgi:hypothetical protein